MLKTAERDLLVLSKNLLGDDASLHQEIKVLNEMLPAVEVLQKVAHASEIFDLNRCRHFRQSDLVLKRLQEKTLASFVFVCNKN